MSPLSASLIDSSSIRILNCCWHVNTSRTHFSMLTISMCLLKAFFLRVKHNSGESPLKEGARPYASSMTWEDAATSSSNVN